MASFEIDSTFYLWPSDSQNIAVFNDESHPWNVGVITDIAGLDSPEVRESADNLIADDGGVHGDFFYGRRPIVLTGLILNPTSVENRNYKMDLISKASNAMRSDSYLVIFPKSGAPGKRIPVRRQQPLRFTGGWQKEFQISLVAEDPRIYGVEEYTSEVLMDSGGGSATGRPYPKVYPIEYGAALPTGQLLLANSGTTPTYPFLDVYGPGVNPVITNMTTGEQIALTYTLNLGEYLRINTSGKTVLLNGLESRYSAVRFLDTSWFGLVPGTNDIRLGFDSFSAGSKLVATWRDAWI